MSNTSKLVLIGFLLLAISHWPLASFAEVPHLINYQAKLTDSGGNPLEGAYDIAFRIYDDETAGELLWEEVQEGVVLQKGIFSTLLGSVTELNLSFDAPYWLAIKVGSDSEMTPRQQIASSAYTFNAATAEAAEKIKASSTDETADYLDQKTDNSTIEVDSTTQQLQLKDAGITYNKFSDDVKEHQIKAWVNFNGQGTVYIRDSYNVASIVDKGTGNYQVHWDTDFANANYAFSIATDRNLKTGVRRSDQGGSDPTASALWFESMTSSETRVDPKFVTVIAIGDQ